MEREKDRISLSVIKWIIYIQIPRFICDSPQNLFCELNNLYLANSERFHLCLSESSPLHGLSSSFRIDYAVSLPVIRHALYRRFHSQLISFDNFNAAFDCINNNLCSWPHKRD